MQRTLASQTPQQVGQTVTIQGWVNSRRDHGKIVFLDIRDRSGLVQVVTTKDTLANPEDVVEIVGLVKARPESLINAEMESGTVEIEAESVRVVTKAKTLPFPIDTDGLELKEELRLKYRYLDLRRSRMARNIRLHSKAAHFVRNWLIERDFVEIDTPALTKSTPEGARDFLVPSRLQPGKFYALPQSPQQYKQMLMVAGFERYFQFAHCFRDEDPRADRSYGEFIQLDMEMSFITQEDLLQLIESMFTEMVAAVFPDKYISQTPWPRLSHTDAIAQYGTDKPDLRKNKQDPNELAFSWTLDFPLFTQQSEEDFFHGSGNAKFAPSHHMFTSPHPDDIPLLETDPMKVRGLQHDLVLNGYEVGGGSIRIHDAQVQEKIFELIGFTQEQKHQFEHILNAFQYGVPPHGGIAPGFDRLMYVILGEPSIREVTPFPNTASGNISVMDAPSEVSPQQLAELGISTVLHKKPVNGSVFETIIQKLQSLHMSYQVLEHAPALTSEQAAQIRGTSLEQGAKALVMLSEKKPIMVVVPGNKKVDLKKVKQMLGSKDVEMAPREVVEKITGLPIGAIPPMGSLFDLKTYIDQSLAEQSKISFNAGLHDKSILMSYKDYVRAEQLEVADLSKE